MTETLDQTRRPDAVCQLCGERAAVGLLRSSQGAIRVCGACGIAHGEKSAQAEELLNTLGDSADVPAAVTDDVRRQVVAALDEQENDSPGDASVARR